MTEITAEQRAADLELIAKSPNRCGPCGMCCKVMAVPEMRKTDGQWCGQFCKGIGCRIYPDRPKRCEEFYCLWRIGLLADAELRPDRCKVVFSPGAGSPPSITAFVNESRPDAWEKPAVMGAIKHIASSGMLVIISIGPTRKKRMFYLDRLVGKESAIVSMKWIRMSEPDENGVQWYEGEW